MRIQLVVLNDKKNLNGAVCTREFIEEIAGDPEYEHLPLFCDLDALREHRHLSHNYDPMRDEFKTSQIGSFINFQTLDVDGVLYLVGTAKVSKRNRYIIDALQELADRNELKFSYEIETVATVDVDGVEYITGNAGNKLVGVAVVTEPAVPEAKALLVAERENEKEDDQVDKLKTTPEEVPAKKEKPTDESPVEKAACGNGKEKAEDMQPAPEAKPVKKDAVPKEEKPEDETAACGTGKEKAEDGEGGKEQLIELSALKEEFAALKERCAALEEELKQRKTAEETQAREMKRQELLDKMSKVLDEEEILALQDALDNLDENAINAALAEKLIREKVQPEAKKTASLRITDSCAPKKNKWITE